MSDKDILAYGVLKAEAKYTDLLRRVREAVEEIKETVEAYELIDSAPVDELGRLCIALLYRHGLIEESEELDE